MAELRRARSLTGDPVADYRLGLAHEFIGEKKKAAYYFKRAFMRSDGTVGK
ncbi:MAG: hypothetical protein ACE5FU_06945 [Nitrospinota bacterium]